MNSTQHIKNRSKAVWGSSPAGTTFAQHYKKGTQDFFSTVLEKRFSYECDWLDQVVNFKNLKGKKVLEIGSGAGYDAYMFCKYGADYTGIDITPDNPKIAAQHLSFFGYSPKFINADAEEITFNNEFDYVYSFGVLHHTPDINKALKNIYTALKKNGQAEIIVYNKHSLFYWLSTVLSDWILRRGFLHRTLAQQRSFVEFTESSEKPLVNVYSKQELKALMIKAGFTIQKTHIRKLVGDDLSGIILVGRFLKYIPQKILSNIGKLCGWYVCVTGIKK